MLVAKSEAEIHLHSTREAIVKSFCVTFILLLVFPCSDVAAQQIVKHEKAVVTAIHNATLGAAAPGLVLEIKAKAGSDVSKGDTIVTLNREIFEAQLQVALEEAEIANIQAQNDVDVELAAKQLEVNCKLLERSTEARRRYTKSVVMTELDRAKLAVEQSQLSIKQAKVTKQIAEKTSNLRMRLQDVAELNLENRQVKAPNDGRVAQIFVQEGEWVNSGQPIARVINLKKLRVKGVFKKDYALSIKKGDKCEFRYSIGENTTTLESTVSYVGQEIVEDIFQVWADLDNPSMKLVPGVRGRLSIEIPGAKLATNSK